MTGLERVKNPYTWELFYKKCANHLEEGDCHMDFTRAGSAVKELWHASGATDILCKSKIGFVMAVLGCCGLLLLLRLAHFILSCTGSIFAALTDLQAVNR